jgi:hypothetical protein
VAFSTMKPPLRIYFSIFLFIPLILSDILLLTPQAAILSALLRVLHLIK